MRAAAGMTLSMSMIRKQNDAKSDLLLRFFESEAFDEWFAIVYLHSSTSPGVQDYLSNKLFELSELGVERYLLQLVYIAVSRPGSAIERTIIELCSRSFRLALKIHWLLLALCQDQPKNRHLEIFKQKCERAALDGRWVVPFENSRLDPLSPSGVFSPTGPISPSGGVLSPGSAWHQEHYNSSAAHFSNTSDYDDGAAHFLGQGLDGFLPIRPASPVRQPNLKLDFSCLESAEERGLTMSHLSGTDSSRYDHLRQQLGEGEGVTALLVRSKENAAIVRAGEDDPDLSGPPLSPLAKLRHDRFGATLDFIDVLCAASSQLASLSQDARLKALRQSLEAINQEIELATRRDVAILYPMGKQNLRVLQIAHKEAVLLNSRDKAPFMLFVEVLEEPEEEEHWMQSLNHVAGKSSKLDTADCADSAHSLLGSGRHSRAASSASVHDSAMTELHCDSCAESPEAQQGCSHPGNLLGPAPAHGSSTPDPNHGSVSERSTTSPFLTPLTSSPSPSLTTGTSTPVITYYTPFTTTPPPATAQTAAAPFPRNLTVDVRNSNDTSSSHPSHEPTPCESPMYSYTTPRRISTQSDGVRTNPVSSSTTMGHSAPPLHSASLPPIPPSSAANNPASTSVLLEIAQKPLELANKIKGMWDSGREEELHSQQELLTLLEGKKPEQCSSVVQRIDAARASLVGDAPLVKLIINILDEPEDALSPRASISSEYSTEQDLQRRQSAGDAGPSPTSSGLFSSLSRKLSDGVDAATNNKAMALLQSFQSKIGLCRRPEAGVPGSGHPRKPEPKLLTVRLEIAGGINLNVQPPHRRSRRMPSHEAIDMMAGKLHVHSIPPPSESGPPLALPPTTTSSSESIEVGEPDAPPPEPPAPSPTECQRGVSCHENARQCLQRSISEAISAPIISTTDKPRREPLTPQQKAQREACAVYGERWSSKVKRLQRQSHQGKRKGWALRCAIVKTGDDCRQEQMAIQLIRAFQEIWQEAGLPLWVKPYEVLCTSNKTALIELIPDAVSIHSIKHRSPAGTSLSDHFFCKFVRGTPECAVAQRNFVESLAAYSIICYILQIKDRHNGNIMLDDEGHVVHIDFGFMLSNSPGGVNFETSPFKLTREYLEVMDSNAEGRMSELFDLFKVLFLQGFLAVRKKCDRIVLLVKMMSKSGFPCFKAGDKTVKSLEKRLHLGLSDVQCVQIVLQLIGESMDSWRTRQYDYYQRVLNGIL